MIHLGDIKQISGETAPTVDCIIGGSPCQDLSIAGKRAGLDGERSSLFMEQIRIVKEMRERDKRIGRTDIDIRPRYMVWENVPGAFSSNRGEDFRTVLEEVARVNRTGISVPRPENGKWSNSGAVIGDGYSIAWRVLDARFWGLPQRRRRICLVADFNGYTATEILFHPSEQHGSAEREDHNTYFKRFGEESGTEVHPVSKSLSGHPDPRTKAGKATSTDAERCINVFDCRGNGDGNTVPTMTGDHQNRVTDYTGICVEIDRASFNQGMNAKFDIGIRMDGISNTVVAKGPSAVAYAIGNGQADQIGLHHNAGALNCMHDQQAVICAVDIRNGHERETNGAIQSNASHSLNCNNTVRTGYIVRRLTPLECERLQGYPDGWTDIGDFFDTKGKRRKASDAVRYKALGNSIALPQWKWILKRICSRYERDATMASLFDGIGGFPLLWEQINGKGSCLWASEIDEFPIAVTKTRIGV